MNTQESRSKMIHIFRSTHPTIHAMEDEIDRLTDARRDQRHPGGHGFKDRFGATFLAGGNDIRVDGMIAPGNIFISFELGMPVRDPQLVKTVLHKTTGRSGKQDHQTGDLLPYRGKDAQKHIRSFDELWR
jgi:hypothetical protein